MLRRPSRRSLLRLGTFRRAFEAISAWLQVAIGADMPLEGGDGATASGTSKRDGSIARRKRAVARGQQEPLGRRHDKEFDRAHGAIKRGIEIDARHVSNQNWLRVFG
eukprot:410608-Pleurochrysis_carterae.AAC.3